MPRSKALRSLSVRVFAEHPINAARVRAGKRPATMAWLWGQGKKPSMPSFASRLGLRGAMITAVDLLSGIAAYMGWDRLHVPGVTSSTTRIGGRGCGGGGCGRTRWL